MRMTGRERGKFTALNGLRKVTVPPDIGGRYAVIIQDRAGLPVPHLTEWFHQRTEPATEGTRDAYFAMSRSFIGFLLDHHYSWRAEPAEVRDYYLEFLRDDLQCVVRPAATTEGYIWRPSGRSPISPSSLAVLQAGVRDFYAVMIQVGWYPYPNPMDSEVLLRWKREHLHRLRNAGAPDHAGIRSESRERTAHHPTGFFRSDRGKIWAPTLAMETDERIGRLQQAITFMIKEARTLRMKVVLLLLLQTGARGFEVRTLTAGGYRKNPHPHRAVVQNKGSLGREVKTIYFTSAELLGITRYIANERCLYDPQGRMRLEQLDDGEPIFLTQGGKAYTRHAFYHDWHPLYAAARERYAIAFSPHDIRALHTTTNMARIKAHARASTPDTASALAVEKELIEGYRILMGWRSHETIATYIKSFSARQALIDIVLGLHAPAAAALAAPAVRPAAPAIALHEATVPSLTEVLPNDDEDLQWY